jgi:hypothetical protein
MQHSIDTKPGDGSETPGPGPVWPDAATDDAEPIATAALDPQDPALRAWFVAESRRLHAQRQRLGMLVPDGQRPIPEAVGEGGRAGSDDAEEAR